MKVWFTILACLALPVWADCPAPADISAELDTLIGQARAAPNDAAGREVSSRMWELWLKAPDSVAQDALDTGMKRRSNYDFLGAIDAYSRLIDYCPDYAEGYNQRAFIYFLTEDYSQALVDLDAALELSPNHVGAQSGRALTLMNLGRHDDARQQLIEALDNNPWLSERYLMLEGGPLALSGKDI